MTITKALTIGTFANFIWGLAFIIPYLTKEIDPIIITAGRYVSYGFLSLLLVPFLTKGHLQRLTFHDWKVVLVLSFTGNIGYYGLLVAAIHLAGVQIAALIIGTLPVTIAIIGNIVEKEFEFRRLLPAILIILAGLCILNGSKVMSTTDPMNLTNLAGGIFLAGCALVLWTMYGVTNARYMKKNPQISANLWSIAIGLATGFQALVILIVLVATHDLVMIVDFSPLYNQHIFLKFLAGSLVLGTIVSWYATVLWNNASRALPVAVAGQLVVFETLSSLLYAYVIDKRLPDVMELSSGLLIIIGVVIGIRATIAPKPDLKSTEPQPSN
ncbi:DMT family transporter [Agrobacterium vitis]|uniref:DMT family transporter n=1 Tax=Agrobacterium vitis TaxID=373 RepID=UPI003D2A1508